MSKEELLKYLIAEIDLIMHDKDYRFENANGTWYSRESCRDLTNEEVFEELRTELRQFADLEAKLAESEKKAYSRGHSQRDIANEIKLNALREDVANKEKRIVELKQQLEKSEKSKESYRLQNEDHHLKLLQFYSRLGVEAFGADIHEKALETLMIMKEQLAITEKALELACKEITGSCEYCSYKTKIECPVEADCLDEKINYFKTKAKEMLENEK